MKVQSGVVATFKTDNEGRFRITLPAGHYTVSKKDSVATIGNYSFEVECAPRTDEACSLGMRHRDSVVVDCVWQSEAATSSLGLKTRSPSYDEAKRPHFRGRDHIHRAILKAMSRYACHRSPKKGAAEARPNSNVEFAGSTPRNACP